MFVLQGYIMEFVKKKKKTNSLGMMIIQHATAVYIISV